MESKEFIKFIYERTKEIYGNPDSILKRYKYLPQYLKIIENKEYGTARQMVVLLVGKSKKTEVVPILIELLKDTDVEGHALQALGNYGGDDIEEIMHQYSNHKTTWIRNTAKKYLKSTQSH